MGLFWRNSLKQLPSLMFNQFLSITAGRFLEFFVPWMILTHTHVPALATAAMAVIPLSSALLILPLGQWVGRGSITHLPRLSQLLQGTSFLFLALLMHTGLSVANLLWAIFGTVIVYAQAASVLNLTLSPQLRVVFGRDQMTHLSNYREGVRRHCHLDGPYCGGNHLESLASNREFFCGGNAVCYRRLEFNRDCACL
jgi:hypothetical protein